LDLLKLYKTDIRETPVTYIVKVALGNITIEEDSSLLDCMVLSAGW